MNCKVNCFCKAIFSLIITMSIMSSCSDYDSDFGLGYIPSDQTTTLNSAKWYRSQGDPINIDAYLCQEEALLGTGIGVAILGQYSSDSFGEVTASSYVRFVPTYILEDDYEDLSSFSPQSLWIYLHMSESMVVSGDEDKTQRFIIYEAPTTLDDDEIYFTNYDPFGALYGILDSEADSLAYFELTSNTNSYVEVFACEGKEAKFLDFKDRLAAADGNTYESYDEFMEDFAGMVIMPDTINNPPTLLFASELDYANLKLDITSTEDSTSLYFYFYDDTDYNNISLAMISHNYPNTAFNGNTVHFYPYQESDYYDDDYEYDYNEIEQVEFPEDATLLTDKAWIQSLGGATTMLHFTDEFVDSLRALKYNDRDSTLYNNLVVNRALIRFPLTSDYAYSTMMKRLGMFYDYQNSLWMPDYLYVYEQSGYTIDYNGYINTASNKYIMDITMYIQRLIISDQDEYKNTPQLVNLTPDIGLSYSFGEVELDLSALEFEILYTLTK